MLQDAGPNTILDLADQQVPLIQVLREMAAALRALLPQEKLEVMLGVPANANTNQRFLTVEAFRSAGCEVVGLLNEPSAASIEFGHKTKINGMILVYDLGGGTFDASLVEVGERTHRPIATEGIATLGGDDFDEILAELATPATSAMGSRRPSTFDCWKNAGFAKKHSIRIPGESLSIWIACAKVGEPYRCRWPITTSAAGPWWKRRCTWWKICSKHMAAPN